MFIFSDDIQNIFELEMILSDYEVKGYVIAYLMRKNIEMPFIQHHMEEYPSIPSDENDSNNYLHIAKSMLSFCIQNSIDHFDEQDTPTQDQQPNVRFIDCSFSNWDEIKNASKWIVDELYHDDDNIDFHHILHLMDQHGLYMQHDTIVTDYGRTVLMEACRLSKYEIVKELVDKLYTMKEYLEDDQGDFIDINLQDEYGWTAFMYACDGVVKDEKTKYRKRDIRVIQYIVEIGKADVFQRDYDQLSITDLFHDGDDMDEIIHYLNEKGLNLSIE
jgi:ankyrin repeat protein